MTFGSTELTPYADRTLVGQRYAHCHPYQRDSEPDSYYRQASLRVPRPLPTVAIRLQDPRLRCERNLGWSIDWAVAFIIDLLEKKTSPDAAVGLKNIRLRAANLEREGHLRDLPYRIFNKLDETLFAGHLKNAVFLDIRSLGSEVSGSTHSQGWSLDRKVKRVSIILNGDVLQLTRSRDVIATLIHHMIHAYFLIACGPQDQKEVEYGRLSHGLHFGKIMMTIRKLSAVHGKPLTGLDFGHTLDQARHFYDECHNQQRRPYHRRRGKEKWYCSHCYSDVDGLSEGEIEEWYGGVCKPLLDLPESLHNSNVQIYNDRRHILEEIPRAQTTPSAASNEFIFGNKSVLVSASHVVNFSSIQRAFEKAGSRYLEIHEDVSKDTFERFLELLHTGTYGPDPKHLHAMGLKGPPVIKSPTGSEPYLMTDIRIFKMGAVMGFDELKGIAIDRMYRHGITHEDPVGLLKEIYDGGEPDGDLKQWARKFLTRTPTAVDGDWMGMGAPRTIAEPSNLAKLECDMLGYKARFYDLLQQSSALKYEVSKAKHELMANGLYAAPGRFGAMGVGIPRGVSPPMGLGYGMPVPALGMRPVMGLPWGTGEGAGGDYMGFGEFDEGRWMYE
ncbi:hypothetical protein K458DRAFT_181852 [Lentithecium fluviatile CBS 122367]|uniref:SprT-like domain-containing protein n=1 Tax=Lentithecium fluviatile CBS 122367 TaxID=1168545 RepID=A0A6G1IEJ9_9PLEO|nr:hypothetical protein K458DRAFT_181852 [Lentithecium fluviatile CBS 122367]